MGRNTAAASAPKSELALAPIEATKPAAPRTDLQAVEASPAAMMVQLANSGMKADEIRAMLAVQQEWEANEARKAFVAAMAAFKAEPMVIEKRKVVDFNSSKGRTHYTHAGLDDVTRVIVPMLAKHGLSHSWLPAQNGRDVSVTCTITHRHGHSESVKLGAAADDSGNKNLIQQVASTTTYLSRYTLLLICGLATEDVHDDDGRGFSAPDAPALITEEQQAKLLEMIEATETDKPRFLEYLKIERLSDLWAQNFEAAMNILRAKQRVKSSKS